MSRPKSKGERSYAERKVSIAIDEDIRDRIEGLKEEWGIGNFTLIVNRLLRQALDDRKAALTPDADVTVAALPRSVRELLEHVRKIQGGTYQHIVAQILFETGKEYLMMARSRDRMLLDAISGDLGPEEQPGERRHKKD